VQVALNKTIDRQPEAVSVLKPVVAPGEVSEPQALDRVQIRRKLGFSDLRHAPKFRSTRLVGNTKYAPDHRRD
jgi:hypothetical protein